MNIEQSKAAVRDAVIAALGSDELTKEQVMGLIEVPKKAAMGDYAFPTFQLAKTLHKSPVVIAQDTVKNINDSAFNKVEAKGPYINFSLKREDLSQSTISEILDKGANYGDSNEGKKANITIDMSSPNIAKPMSMGHLRSTVIGNSIAKVLSKLDYQPIKINYLGDWGTQFGKLMVAYKKWGSEEAVRRDPITNLQKYYVKFHQEDKKDPELDDEAREWFRKLETGDEEATYLWKWFRSASLKAFQKVYDQLGVEFDSHKGESFYNDKMDEVVQMLEDKHLLKESQGAQIVDLGDTLPPAMIKKSDAATLYLTRDLAAAIYRKRTYNFKKSLYVVGSEQSVHFDQLKAVLKLLGFGWYKDIEHIKFGLITSGGKKLSTRNGRVILLEKVLKDSVKLAQEQIEEKNPTLNNKDQVAHDVGVGAVIFHDLKNNRVDNFDFKLEDVVRFEGETGPYVQYSHARAMSILRKADYKAQDAAINPETIDDNTWSIIKLLADFPVAVEQSGAEREPSVIAKYALKLAKAFNHYYAHTKVLVEDDQLQVRLNIVNSIATILKESLDLLGVKAPDEM